jgi:conjugal transfer/entry exclusion protein
MTKLAKRGSKAEDLRLALVSLVSLVVQASLAHQASQGAPHLHSRLALGARQQVDLRQLTHTKCSSK